jgi:hypothetical protein
MSYSPYSPQPPKRSGSTATIIIAVIVAVVVLVALCCGGLLIWVKTTGGGGFDCSTGKGCSSGPGTPHNEIHIQGKLVRVHSELAA